MRFSFITCTYNRAEHLRKTLASLLDQEFDNASYEIVVIDNNSMDQTKEVCDEFVVKHPNKQFRYFKETNQGLSHALNRGIKEAQGEFLIYVDDDETIEKGHLKCLDNHLSNDPEVAFCASAVIPIYEEKEPKWMSPFTQRLIGGYFEAGDKVIKLNKKSYPGTGHTIIKRELYFQYGFYNTDLGRKGTGLMGAEDKDMVARLIDKGVDCYFFPHIPIYHHIPAYKLTDDFFSKLTQSIGKSERVRTLSVSKGAYRKRLLDELVKWGASLVLFFYYLMTFRPSKGYKLLEFRRNVSRGLLKPEC